MTITMNCELTPDYFSSARNNERIVMRVKLVMIYSNMVFYLMLQFEWIVGCVSHATMNKVLRVHCKLVNKNP